jgi:hypothetical protein
MGCDGRIRTTTGIDESAAGMAALFYARLFCEHPFNVGASLLANAVDQVTTMSTDLTISRAGSLPQGFV